ncbi:MAG: P-loop NTPase, partial [Actinomycetota bacterium]
MRVLLVVSGKGGVGKSTVAIGLAQGLARRGHKVGLLDADLENPCLPVLAAATRPGIQADGKLAPAQAHGLAVFSIGASMDRDLPVLVGEQMKVGIVEEMLRGIDWGELDYLVIDTPPGSSAEVKTIITNS